MTLLKYLSKNMILLKYSLTLADNSEVSSNENKLLANIIATISLDSVHQIKDNNDGIPRLCAPCVGSKSAQIVGQENSMTLITYKLKQVCIDL